VGRIIVDFPENLPPDLALKMVEYAVGEGKISIASGVPHYCWVISFSSGWMVHARRKKKGQTSDSFMVRKQ